MTHIEELEMKVRIREREVAELKEQLTTARSERNSIKEKLAEFQKHSDKPAPSQVESVQDWQHRYDQLAFAKGSVDAGVNGVIREILAAHEKQVAEQRKRILELEDFLAMVHRSLRFESVNDMKIIVNRVPELETQVAELKEQNAELTRKLEEALRSPAGYEEEIARCDKLIAEFKASGDMYGVNFHEGRQSGIITGDIVQTEAKKHLQSQIAELERKLADALNDYEGRKATEEASVKAANDFLSRLLAAEAHIGVLRNALVITREEQEATRGDGLLTSPSRIRWELVVQNALASSPDTTLKDRVVQVLNDMRLQYPDDIVARDNMVKELGGQP
jgi:hypothetical protein